MCKETLKKGELIVISGPSAVGKSTICAELVRTIGAFLSVSSTTRPPGQGEINGREYWFIERAEFEAGIERGEFLEYAEVFGNLYGTSRPQVEKALAEQKVVILEIDVQGALLVRKEYEEAVTIFILPPSREDLAERMNNRARGEDDDSIKARLDKADAETALAREHYEYMVVNADIEKAVEEIRNIIQANTRKKI